jgi:cobalamin biosynthetic protein CobC
MPDHGGNLDLAIRQYGGTQNDWIDLSTGINRRPYPVPAVDPAAWAVLPLASATQALIAAAGKTYRAQGPILAVAGAQAVIQLIPLLSKAGHAKIISPTYNEHAGALRAMGWHVQEVTTPQDLVGADLAIVVNPNNPDGRVFDPAVLLPLLQQTGRLIVDESFADATPEISLAPYAGRDRLIVLRSFGKFYGLAGLRLGFVLGSEADISALSRLAGPWPVSGPALQVGTAALADTAWAEETVTRLNAESPRMDAITAKAGWCLVGATALFRLYATPDAAQAQQHLAQSHIWARIFPYSSHWMRLGLPGNAAEWVRLANALGTLHGV